MSTEELKHRILREMEGTESENLLRAVLDVFINGAVAYQSEDGELTFREPSEAYGQKSKTKEMHILSEWQKQSIERGLKDIEEGRFLTTAELERSLDQWLKD